MASCCSFRTILVNQHRIWLWYSEYLRNLLTFSKARATRDYFQDCLSRQLTLETCCNCENEQTWKSVTPSDFQGPSRAHRIPQEVWCSTVCFSHLIGQWFERPFRQRNDGWYGVLDHNRLSKPIYLVLRNINQSATRKFMIVVRLQTAKMIDLTQLLSIVTQSAEENSHTKRNFLFNQFKELIFQSFEQSIYFPRICSFSKTVKAFEQSQSSPSSRNKSNKPKSK